MDEITALTNLREVVVFRRTHDWRLIHTEALLRSPELRRSKWRVKQRELELIATKNHLLPRLDAFGRYRFLGFGDQLIYFVVTECSR